ncbi:winged helix-turn-helix transcriptional regulator [Thalassobius sp. MITS945101]|uniref:winged helix-turn-helix transcriptional regulator n=1 Tax=Thalassobius sp. MITS945101 TaxID=3096994 RepID=UPI00399A5EC0
MAKTRSYKLLCPIARALDRIGDRWTLLILRDLMAGPARFSELQKGLKGIAANLLTERLNKLTRDGLITQQELEHGVTVYVLTALGQKASDVVFELAMFGANFGPEGDVIAPGNLRTVATTLGLAAKRVVPAGLQLDARIVVDAENIYLSAKNGTATVRYSEKPIDQDVAATLVTSYAALMALTDGELTMAAFLSDHSQVSAATPEAAQDFALLMQEIIGLLGQ